MSRYCLTIRSSTKFGILLSTGFNRIFHHLIIPLITPLHGFGIVFPGISQCNFHRRIFFLPIRLQVLPEILDRGNVVIANHQIAFCFLLFHITQIFAICQENIFLIYTYGCPGCFCNRQHSFFGKTLLNRSWSPHRHIRSVRLFTRQIKIPPINTNDITTFT